MHNPKVAGSNPAPATKNSSSQDGEFFAILCVLRTFSFEASFDEDQGNLSKRTSWYDEKVSDDLSRK